MKFKPLIPFNFLDKYKYFYFVINSFIVAALAVLLGELLNDGDFTLKHIVHDFFFAWGFMYPVSFIAYENAKKNNRKRQEKNNCNE